MMKKIISVLLALVLMTGCAAVAAAEGVPGGIAGGWRVTDAPEITAEAKAAFDKALEGLTGAGYEPVALLSTQVVAGINYCFLCRGTTVTAVPDSFYALVYIAEDLQHNASVMDIQRLSFDPAYPGLPEEDGQNPVMNIVGNYEDETSGRAVMSIEAGEGASARIRVSWGNGANETYCWEFTGEYDPLAEVIPYENGVKTIVRFDGDGNETDVTVYENGTGVFHVESDGSVTWRDDTESAGADCRFVWIGVPEPAAEE